jgi:heterotetrameric sarcosine oxidase alpha subunit
MTARRLAQGGRIDRTQPLDFTWDGRALLGCAGDTLASALMANGVQLVGRSFKYHRPRGIMSAGVEESGAIVSVGSGNRLEPNVKATMQELFSGLEARGQNAWPSVRFDLGATSDRLGRFFAAGFYYKMFMGLPPFEWGRGTAIWMQYEKLIRRAAGMGRASRQADPDCYDHVHGFCDLLVVGAGPAGLSAAAAAAGQGMDVLLVEQDFMLGGSCLNSGDDAAEAERLSLVAAVEKAGVRIMTRTTAFGLYDNGVAGLIERVTDHLHQAPSYLPRQRFWTIRPKATILATGALERSMAFGNNDRPGVMTATAARTYLNRFGVLPGTRVVIAANNDSAYAVAHDLAAAGAGVTLADARKDPPEQMPAGVDHRCGTVPLEVLGRHAVDTVALAQDDGGTLRRAEVLPCDLLLVSGGWSPVVNLLSHHGGKPVWDPALACFLPGATVDGVTPVGAAAGCWDHAACLESGQAAVAALSGAVVSQPQPGGWKTPIKPVYEIRLPDPSWRKGARKAFVDFQHDVTTADIRLAHQEGFVSVEHLKRYTTLGMATDQGKMGNVIGLALMADALGKDVDAVGTTRFRPPYTPVAIGALAGRHTGRHFRPLRRTPLHDWNLDHGATMTMAGLWHRPWYFAQAGETIKEAYIREAATVRRTVGLCDVSSLGKIAVQGPDAAAFLNRVYTNTFATLPVGRARYGIMLRDDGIVMDDGTTWRLAENDYLMTTTTTHAGKVMVWLEELLQTRWPDLRVHVTSVSDQWAGIAVAGPLARDTLAAALDDEGLVSAEALPFMGVTCGIIKGGAECRIARISFSGELAYEIYVPAGMAPATMDLLWPAARDRDGCLYGLEALGTLRIEKGHVTGAELDGRVTLDDAGLGKMASRKKPFIGAALRSRPDLQRPDRPQLVGVFPKDRGQTFKSGALLFQQGETEGFGAGWITAVTHSPALGHWIGLGYIAGGQKAWQGRRVMACDPLRGGDIEVDIVSPHMFDPEGERMHD